MMHLDPDRGATPAGLVLLASAALLVPGCSDSCDLDSILRDQAGSTAVDCGRAAIDAGASVDQCVVQAFRAARPFRASWDEQGIDSQVRSGVAYGPDGRLYLYLWDGDPSGGSQVGARTERWRCTAASVEVLEGREQLLCNSREAGGVVCGG